MADLEVINKFQELASVLADGINTQQEVLNAMRDSLSEYIDFLNTELNNMKKEVEHEIRTRKQG